MPGPTRRQFLRTAACGAAGAGAAVSTAARAVEGSSYSLQGIDVSRWQATVNWGGVRGAGKRFAFCKATDGTSTVDPRFTANWPAMKAAGLLRGAYHYGRPAGAAAAQADFFCDTVGFAFGDLKPVLDLEATDGLTPTQLRSWVVAFVDRVKVRVGQAPIIYTGFYFWRDQAGNGSSLGCPLWLAAYNTNPLVPAAWTKYTLWQYTDEGSCGGVTGNVDLDALNGTKTELNNLRLS